jgi:hypothetical protein
MVNHRIYTLCAAVVVALVIATTAHALSGPERTMYLTFDRSVALPGVTLAPGSYVFERATPLTSANVVRVTSRSPRRVVFQGFTDLVERPAGWTDDRFVSIGEARPGDPQPILAWYPAGTRQGHRFLY